MKPGNHTARYLTRDDGSWDKSSGSKDEQKLKVWNGYQTGRGDRLKLEIKEYVRWCKKVRKDVSRFLALAIGLE